jgi:signal transduction histidine kinase
MSSGGSEGRTIVAMRMRTTLLLCLVSISFGVLTLNLVIIHSVLQKQIRSDISADLGRSVVTFRNIQAQRQEMLLREVSLLAALPVLKSLMTTSDAETIRDGAADFYHLSGGDLFALADQNGNPVAVFEGGYSWSAADVVDSISQAAFTTSHPHYLLLRGNLYEIASQPLYFGSPINGTRLGYVILGFAVNRHMLEEVSQVASADVIVFAGSAMVATTLDQQYQAEGVKNREALLSNASGSGDTWFGREHFEYRYASLASSPDPIVNLIVLKSYDLASRYLTRLNRVLLLLGAILLVVSGTLAVYLATSITRPLDKLVAGARALGAGNFDYQLRRSGAMEIRELGDAFDLMRHRLKHAREELLANERLATIGRMASSISHDLRHYLSAVYANAEFLGYDSVGQEERVELLTEIRQGVRGMTELIESLLLFSRTGQSMQLSYESLPFLVDRSIAMVRSHPDAQNVRFEVEPMPQMEVWLDTLKIERALYNLLLNGCQAARQGTADPKIEVSLKEDSDQVALFIADNGPGVSESVRVTLFQPFVSEGKASGIGLGLTLALKIAQEHGGAVTLEASQPGRTVFRLSLAKSTLRQFAESAQRFEKSIATD